MFSRLAVLLLVYVGISVHPGCSVTRDDLFTSHVTAGSHPATAVPPPSPTCPGGYSSIDAFFAAQAIAERYCVSIEEDGNMSCIAPIVARYCPDVTACQENLCLDQMELLGECMQQSPPSPDCVALFPPVQPASSAPITTWTFPWGRTEVNVVSAAGHGFIYAGADFAYLDNILAPVSENAQIVGYKIRLRGPTGGGTGFGVDPTLNVRRSGGDGTADLLGQLRVESPPSTWQTYSFTLQSPVRVVAGESFAFLLQLGTADVAVSSLGLVTVP